MSQNKKPVSIHLMTAVGLMAALVFASSYISINIPTILGVSRIHFGNAFCLLSGFLLGGVPGGLAAGIGSCFFDLTNPLYISSAPFTFVFKFLLAFVAGKISHGAGHKAENKRRNLAAAICGSLTYAALYVGKNFLEDTLFLRTELQTALIDAGQKCVTSLVNAAIAVILSMVLWPMIHTAIRRTPMAEKLHLS